MHPILRKGIPLPALAGQAAICFHSYRPNAPPDRPYLSPPSFLKKWKNRISLHKIEEKA